MIETVNGNKRNGIIDFLSSNPDLSLDDARFCIEKSDRVIVYKNDSSDIVGCGTFLEMLSSGFPEHCIYKNALALKWSRQSMLRLMLEYIVRQMKT